MTIETKYDIFQKVWVMLRQPEDNIMTPAEPDERAIHGITREIWKDGFKTIYHLEKYRGMFRCDYEEHEVFATKQDLLNSL